MPITNKNNQENMFFKGIDSDTSFTEKDPATMLDAQNIRIIRNENNNLWVQSPKGMVKTFSLTEGFIPLGSESFQGILFIFSVSGQCVFLV